MDAASALADLTEISSQIEAAVVFDADGGVLASTLADDERSTKLARAGGELFDAAAGRLGGEGRTLLRIEAALDDGSVFVVREHGHGLVATTTPAPASGLVLYDLGTCLRSLAEAPPPKPKRKQPRKQQADA